MPFPPLDPVTVTVSGVTTFIRLFEITYQLKAVDGQTAALLRTVQHVQRNINEAQRLRQLKLTLLNKGDIQWMDKIIDDTHKALLELAKLIEKVRVDQETKQRIGFGHRAMWVFRDNPDVVNKHREMSICHESLAMVISMLHSKDVVVVTPTFQTNMQDYHAQHPPPAYDPAMTELFERRQTLKHRKTTSCMRSKSLGNPKPTEIGQLRPNTVPHSKSQFAAPRSSSVRNRVESTNLTTPESSKATIGLKATKEDLRAARSAQDSSTRPTHRITTLVDPSSGYLDDISALHRLSFGDDNFSESTIPPRPPKLPLQQASFSPSPNRPPQLPLKQTSSTPSPKTNSSRSSSVHGQETDYLLSPTMHSSGWVSPRSSKTSWLAYHATRSDIGDLSSGGDRPKSAIIQAAACLHPNCPLAVSPKALHSMAAFAVHQNHG